MAKILIVEDDNSMRELLRMVVELDGHHVLEAADGNAAIAIFERGRPVDLILCDLLMWGMDGFQFIRWLRNTAQRATPVLVVTGMDTLDIQDRVRAVGADDLLLKPVTATQLREKVVALLAKAGAG